MRNARRDAVLVRTSRTRILSVGDSGAGRLYRNKSKCYAMLWQVVVVREVRQVGFSTVLAASFLLLALARGPETGVHGAGCRCASRRFHVRLRRPSRSHSSQRAVLPLEVDAAHDGKLLGHRRAARAGRLPVAKPPSPPARLRHVPPRPADRAARAHGRPVPRGGRSDGPPGRGAAAR